MSAARSIFFVVLCVCLAPLASANAQTTSQHKIVERYKKLVNKSAEESYAFKQLMKQVMSDPMGHAYAELVDEYREKVEQDPENYRWRMLLGHMLRHGDYLEEALTHYQKAAELEETALVYESMGKVYEAMSQRQEAVEGYTRALGLATHRDDRERILRMLASQALEQGKLEEAKGFTAALIELDPKDLFLRREVAELFIEHQHHDQALEHLRDAMEIAGENTSARLQLQIKIAETYTSMGEREKAIATYEEALQSAPSSYAREIEDRLRELSSEK